MPDVSCATFDTKEDFQKAEEWDKTEAGNPWAPSPEIAEAIEKAMPEVERAIEEKVEKIAEARVDKYLERAEIRAPEEKLTPHENAESLFRKEYSKEYNEWRQEVKDEVKGYRFIDARIVEEGRQRLGITEWKKFSWHDGEIMREISGVGMEFYRQHPALIPKTITHEFAEVDYKLMPENEKARLEKEIWPTTNKERERDFFDQWHKGFGEYATKDHQQNYCFWMTALRREEIPKERLDELKAINPEKFDFCRKRCIADEIKRSKERLRKGGSIHFF